MPRKIENIWDPIPSGDSIFGITNIYTTASGEDDTIIGTISISISDEEFYSGSLGTETSELALLFVLESDRAHAEEMAEEYYTGVMASGSQTIVDNNITYRIVEDV